MMLEVSISNVGLIRQVIIIRHWLGVVRVRPKFLKFLVSVSAKRLRASNIRLRASAFGL